MNSPNRQNLYTGKDVLDVDLELLDAYPAIKFVNNNNHWRGASALTDGSEAKLDLAKCMYYAGDFMKFGVPMAFTETCFNILTLTMDGDDACSATPAANGQHAGVNMAELLFIYWVC